MKHMLGGGETPIKCYYNQFKIKPSKQQPKSNMSLQEYMKPFYTESGCVLTKSNTVYSDNSSLTQAFFTVLSGKCWGLNQLEP